MSRDEGRGKNPSTIAQIDLAQRRKWRQDRSDIDGFEQEETEITEMK